ncbi:hypothetical protein ACOSP7_026419 [Xanthoceras sorbifolium]
MYSYRWLPRPSSFSIFSPTVLDPLLKVADLKNPSGGWKSNLEWSAFLLEDERLILNLPCSSSNNSDSLIWHYDRSGVYSVKSGYWVAIEKKNYATASSSSSFAGFSWWRHLWSLKVPSKVKIFLWRAVNNCLPVFQVLRHRHLRDSDVCLCCEEEIEYVVHILWTCPIIIIILLLCLGHKMKCFSHN